ncbi:MAG: hypothetical protein WC832_08435 [Anaerolineales bacterium]
MPEMTIKEWAAAYRADNEAEREEKKLRLPQETIEESVQSYFALCELALTFSGSFDVPVELQERRENYFADLARKWDLLAQRL